MVRLMLALLLCVPSVLHALPYADIIEAAENGPEAEGVELAYEAGLISVAQSALDDTADYSISFAADPLSEMDDGILRVSELSFSAILPDDDTTITASIPSGLRYDGRGAVLSPSASISHTFDWGHNDDRLRDLQTEALRLSVERQYGTDILSIRRSVISLISELISNERELLSSQEELRDIDREINDSLKLGIITEGSIVYEELMLERKRAEDSIGIGEREKEELLLRFRTLTGLEWDGADDIPEPIFPDVLSAEVSSVVSEAELELMIAEEDVLLEESDQNPRRLTIGGSAGGNAEVAEGLYSITGIREDPIYLEGTIGWEGDDWSVSASGGGRWDYRFDFSPSLSLAASWHSGTSESDELRLRSLRNTARIRSDDYYDARRSFDEDKEDIWGRMLSWQREMAELEAETDYRNALYEMILVKYERGLATGEDVHDAELDIRLLDFDRDILLLEGLLLQNEAETLIL